VTDDASAVERLGESVKIYESELPNLKITTVEDLQLAAAVVLKR
jgi:2-C-methyl-D-erythritol 4-phosphate cytidylyltransferase